MPKASASATESERKPSPRLLLWLVLPIVVIGIGVARSFDNRSTPELVPSHASTTRPFSGEAASPGDAATGTVSVNLSSGETATLADLKDRASALRRDSSSEIQPWKELLRDWIDLDPAGALSHLESWQGYDRLNILLPIAMRLWLTRDPIAASDYATSKVRSEPASYDWYLSPLLEHLSSSEGMRGVTSFVRTLPQNDAVYNHVVRVVADYMRSHLADSGQIINSLPYEAAKPGLYEMLGAMYGMSMGWEGLDRAIRDVPDGPYARNAYVGAVLALHTQEPAAVVAWLDSQPINQDLDTIRLRVASSSLNDPEAAVRIAAKISASAVRTETIAPALRAWLGKDFNAAQTWAIESDVDPNLVAEAIVAAEVPPSAFFEQKIKSITASEPRVVERQQVHYFLIWRRAYPEVASRWLEGSDLPVATKQMLRQMNETQDGSRQ